MRTYATTPDESLLSVCLAGDHVLGGGVEQVLRCYAVDSGTLITEQSYQAAIFALAYGDDGSSIYVATGDDVDISDLRIRHVTGSSPRVMRLTEHTDTVYKVQAFGR